MKINAKKYFGINKATDVTVTNRINTLARHVQIGILESQDTEAKITELDYLKNEEKLDTEIKNFLQTVMKYSDKQMDQIDNNLSTEKLGEGIGYLIMRLNGISDHDIDLNEQKQRKAIEDAKLSK
ncbi:phage tail assembly chaperone [Lactiplantibacillus plantarum]|uniref:phage tail assembly chaperone n=1 Tax=Lactiplantibacillus plantarum TaxID=1590 RepID=UPI00351C738C